VWTQLEHYPAPDVSIALLPPTAGRQH
jgi:hypothetical protein